MSVYIVHQSKKENSNLKYLSEVIYYNFEYLKHYPKLKHNIFEITKVLKSKSSMLLFYMYNDKIAGYLVGEIMKLNDTRKVFYVTYIFTGKQFRNQGIAGILLKKVNDIINSKSLDGMLLTCDSEDENVYNFYINKGFMPDVNLRTYDKFEVMFK